MTYNRGKPLKEIQKAAIIEGLESAIAQGKANIASWESELAKVKQERTEEEIGKK